MSLLKAMKFAIKFAKCSAKQHDTLVNDKTDLPPGVEARFGCNDCDYFFDSPDQETRDKRK